MSTPREGHSKFPADARYQGKKTWLFYHTSCPILVVSHQGCVTLWGLRLLCEVIGVKGWFRHIQQRVRNKCVWTLQMPPRRQSHCWNPFSFFFFSLAKTHFCESFFTSCSLWSSHMEGRTRLHPHRLAAVVPILHRLKVTRYLCFLWAVFWKKKKVAWNFEQIHFSFLFSVLTTTTTTKTKNRFNHSLSLMPLLLWIDLADCRLLHYTLTLINSDLLTLNEDFTKTDLE